MIQNVFLYFKTLKIINKACKEEGLLENLSSSFNLHFKKDAIGRIYCVINPIIKNIMNNGNSLIITSTTEVAIQDYLIRNLELLKKFIGEHQFFDILTYEIKKIDNDENYLIVLKSIYLNDSIKFFKRFGYLLITLLILTISGIIIF